MRSFVFSFLKVVYLILLYKLHWLILNINQQFLRRYSCGAESLRGKPTHQSSLQYRIVGGTNESKSFSSNEHRLSNPK